MRAVIVDDERLGRVTMRELLAEHADVEIVGEYSGGAAAITGIPDLGADVVFLDIAMPEVDGIDVALALGAVTARIVFVTGYDQFALRAFELAALDYLVKPVDTIRLASTLARLRDGVSKSSAWSVRSALQQETPGRVMLKAVGSLVSVYLEELVYAEARGNYIRICVQGRSAARYVLVRLSISELAQRLEDRGFLRVHRSYLVNAALVFEIQARRNGRSVILTDGTRLPVGRSYMADVRQKLSPPRDEPDG